MFLTLASTGWQGVCKHLVDNAPSVGIVRCSKNPVDAREKKSNRGRNPLVWLAPEEGELHSKTYTIFVTFVISKAASLTLM